jgi:two-component system, cell cycle response regulator
MDPLVRAALGLQQLIARLAGAAMSLVFAAYLVWSAATHPPAAWDGAVFALLLGWTCVCAVRRLRSPNPQGATPLDLGLFLHLVVVAHALVIRLPGGLDGPAYAVHYALMMLAAAFARPAVAAGALSFTVLIEAELDYWTNSEILSERLLAHAALLGVFTFLNMVVFRAEIARVRRLSRSRIESEIEKMKEAARSYRLLTVPSSAAPSVAPREDETRLLRSGVDEIGHALQFALDLLRRSLGLHTAALFGLDGTASRLHIQELSTDDGLIATGPFRPQDGIFGAALAKGAPVSVCGPKAATLLPYYQTQAPIGAVCAVPMLERGQPRGVLVVDREARDPFTTREEELVQAATRFLLRAVENERVFIQLDRAKSEQGKLYRAVEALAAATTEAQVIETGVSSAREFTAFDFAVVTLFHRSTSEHEICAASGEGADRLVGQRFRHNSGLVSMVVANRHALPYRGDYDPGRQTVFTRRVTPPAMPSLLVLPLLVQKRALGTLVLGSKRKGTFTDSVRPTLEVLASHIAVSLANARMMKRLEELATTDGLTGLFNKRMLEDTAVQKLRSANRFKKPLSVLVCDLDHFKRINDTYGHDVGDVVIRGFSDVLKRTKRDTDVVGRFGGEEFVLVCEETDGRGATLLAERIKSELESTSFHAESGPFNVTCSIGTATCPAAGVEWEALFRSADEALYVSKRSGRNRVTVWTPKMQGCAA